MSSQREWFEKNYYEVLGVAENAPEKDITRAYRKLAKQFHPDTNPGSEEKFKEISAAYDVLGNVERRKEYDEVRRLGPIGGKFDSSGFAGPGGFRVEDLSDLLGGMFNGGAAAGGNRSRRGGRARNPARKGDTLEADVYLSFEDATKGVVTSISVTSDASCGTCGGTGAASGTSPVLCTTCNGRGVTDDNQGVFSFSTPCRTCHGAGMKIEHPCATCSGSGVERRPRNVKVRIPAGVEDSQRIRLRERGGAGRDGGPPGDLFVTVHVGKHALFGRKGIDLTLVLPITFPEAALGATVSVPTLTDPVKLKVPPGTSSGKTFRVRGRGAGVGDKIGDLLVTVDVVVPQKLTDAQRNAIDAYRAVSGDDPRAHLITGAGRHV